MNIQLSYCPCGFFILPLILNTAVFFKLCGHTTRKEILREHSNAAKGVDNVMPCHYCCTGYDRHNILARQQPGYDNTG